MAPSQETLKAECHPSVVGTPRVIDDNTPDLFRPLTIRAITLRNRICVSPMCLYSTASHGPKQGVLTPLYITTIGHNVFKGAALAMLEATGVQPNGRISPHCPGLWNSTQQHALKNLTDFIHSQGGLCGVQLSHAGRKASTLPPLAAARLGKSSARATVEEGGWPDDVVGPSGGLSWDGKTNDDPSGGYYVPREMTKQDIEELISNYASAAERAVDAGVDVVEIHAAHGYLIHQFLSPLTNRRNDEYGGGFDNRVRLLLEVIRAVRGRVPATMPVFVRISVTDWMEDTRLGRELGSWDEESTVRLVKMLPALGVDLVDISSGGNHHLARFNVFDGGEKHTATARRLKQSLVSQGASMLVGTVGMITQAEQARDLVQRGGQGQPGVDIVSIGRQFLRQPDWVLNAAAEIGVHVVWPAQIERIRPGPTARI
jgi:2,4-dienoyl-CoA reductase-like NADH-dependent reductase (Old Yellow Enzyme family)